jgi:hypothetical protein
MTTNEKHAFLIGVENWMWLGVKEGSLLEVLI